MTRATDFQKDLDVVDRVRTNGPKPLASGLKRSLRWDGESWPTLDAITRHTKSSRSVFDVVVAGAGVAGLTGCSLDGIAA